MMKTHGDPGSIKSLNDYKSKKEKLVNELEQLKAGTHPVYLQREQQLRQQLNETLVELIDCHKEQLLAVHRDYNQEMLAATEEFQREAFALQQKIILDLEHQKKLIMRDYQLIRICQQADDQEEELTNQQRELRSHLRMFHPVQCNSANRRLSKLRVLLSKAEIDEDLSLIGQMDPQ